ncbi:MAG: Lrp/AsnC family transcriptional regulator [Actinobacteria bacterium]|nr:Lrp/AsnC family transcriptional regulator [Actinomycetota bacterium]
MLLDQIDCAILGELLARPKAGVRDYARTLGLARGTVQARLDRLTEQGVVGDYAPALSHAALGFPVLAFIHIQLQQGSLELFTKELASLAQVVEAHSVTGDADVLCRVVARDNTDLEAVIQAILDVGGVVRTRTEIALTERVPRRDISLLQELATTAPQSSRTTVQVDDHS